MKKTMAIGLAVLIGVCILNGCIGQDDSESTVTVRRVKSTDSEDKTETVTPQTPENPPQTPPSWNLEEPTPEEEEDARRIALEDERVQDLINGENYELEVTGCGLFPDGEKRCMLLLELENGEKYTIIVNLSQGTVEEIREGEGIEKGKKESGD